jgi:acyl carrier protein
LGSAADSRLVLGSRASLLSEKETFALVPGNTIAGGEHVKSEVEIETEVIDVIRRHLHASDRKLDAWTRLMDDLGADSLAVVELTLVFEETFDIDISDAEAAKIQTVRDAVAAVEKCVRARPVG